MAIVVFDFGGTSVKYGVWAADELTRQSAFTTPATWTEMQEKLQTTFTALKNTVDTVNGVAFSLPGVVDNEKGEIRGESAIPYIHNFPIKAAFSEMFGGLPIALENDANCAALAELWQGSAQDVNNALVIALGTGIGGSVIVNRQLVRGRDLVGGEFGYMKLGPELTWSQMGTVVNAANRYNTQNPGGMPVTGKQLFDLAAAGDVLAQNELNKFYDYNAQGLFNLISSFNPDRIILAGGVSARKDLPQILATRVNQLLKWASLTAATVDIQVSRFSNDANLIGAVKNFKDWHPEVTLA
ncbi:ROK family protein [Lapidilactobacillus luobeiensis]|uniref:ROK family protein n=1 Tax=Lapidilactobacillus luobeiensis TaxID=2950371 RepID=UPI0021C42B6C|nr:ROK family protein [Lapidilactobacillus luobeiensis]